MKTNKFHLFYVLFFISSHLMGTFAEIQNNMTQIDNQITENNINKVYYQYNIINIRTIKNKNQENYILKKKTKRHTIIIITIIIKNSQKMLIIINLIKETKTIILLSNLKIKCNLIIILTQKEDYSVNKIFFKLIIKLEL